MCTCSRILGEGTVQNVVPYGPTKIPANKLIKIMFFFGWRSTRYIYLRYVYLYPGVEVYSVFLPPVCSHGSSLPQVGGTGEGSA